MYTNTVQKEAFFCESNPNNKKSHHKSQTYKHICHINMFEHTHYQKIAN